MSIAVKFRTGFVLVLCSIAGLAASYNYGFFGQVVAEGHNYLATSIACITCLGTIIFIDRVLLAPLLTLLEQMQHLTQDDLAVKISYMERTGDVGKIAAAIEKFKQTMLLNKHYADKIAVLDNQIAAIEKSQAVISFSMDGTILDANPIFLEAMGYRLDEIKGRHHSMFAESAFRNSQEYKHFWESLRRGEAHSGEFKRLGNGGREVWIRARYNPIADAKGNPFKVIKYASDITQAVIMKLETEKGINAAVDTLTRLSAGDLSHKMDGEYVGEFSNIKKALNSTIDKLMDTVLRIRDSALSVNSAAGEISAGSSDLSMRTEQQASSLEETAASMEEITGTVRQNSQNASTANELAATANINAIKGGSVVQEAVTAMANIEKSSQKISDIIGVIDEIAFQTNLLALNAAVEAARAGDAGKGFAVVASEVRALAGRSASASKEIKMLINESASQVKTGAQLVNQAGDTLKNIVNSVKQVATIVSEIASASEQQATGIDEINSAVTQMDEATQQNAALVEENTAAAQSMLEQAQILGRLVSFFNLQEGDGELTVLTKTNSTSKARPTGSSAKPSALSKPNGALGAHHFSKAAVIPAAVANLKLEESLEEF